jgi:hypothetical protein
MRNKPAMFLAVIVALGFATKSWSQTFAPPAGGFQIHYASNLDVGDSIVNISNSGTEGSTDAGGSICVNIYVFDPDETMLACCSCKVTPNALKSLSAKSDLTSNTFPGGGNPTAIVVKLLASKPATPTTLCDASTPVASTLARGMRAWETNLHALPTSSPSYGVTETEFTPGGLSQSEMTKLTTDCGTIETNGGGLGICVACH